MKIRLGIMVAVIFLSGCASGPQFSEVPPSKDYAVLYVYRPYQFVGGGIQPVLRINGLKISKVLDGGYTAVKLEPGKHNLKLHSAAALAPESSQPFYSINLKVKAKQELYFRWVNNLEGIYGGVYADISNEYGFVEKSQAADEIKETKYIGSEQNGIITGL
ncbi:DUF2846 domain-containing protein [Neiella sp. HB171785]|uniref:DUF2846 domain-containing protein n=1 Tax=Neiella litorisoli TaxID=2771431 RepID=A0A8J6UF70_9GAMM|nr:DUF2846 domain-containing protein [Neiella litorisoli]MBD1390659.1 DUF2846 domain-containing protein [Neiella litorisoli]